MRKIICFLSIIVIFCFSFSVPASAETVQELVTRTFTASDIYNYFSGSSDVVLDNSYFYNIGTSDLTLWINGFESDMGSSFTYEIKGSGSSSNLYIVLLSASGDSTSTIRYDAGLNTGEKTYTASRNRTVRNVGLILPFGLGISEFTISYYVEVEKFVPSVNDVNTLSGFLKSLWDGIWNASGNLWIARSSIILPIALSVVSLFIFVFRSFIKKKYNGSTKIPNFFKKNNTLFLYRDTVRDNARSTFFFSKFLGAGVKRYGSDIVKVDGELYYRVSNYRNKKKRKKKNK